MIVQTFCLQSAKRATQYLFILFHSVTWPNALHSLPYLRHNPCVLLSNIRLFRQRALLDHNPSWLGSPRVTRSNALGRSVAVDLPMNYDNGDCNIATQSQKRNFETGNCKLTRSLPVILGSLRQRTVEQVFTEMPIKPQWFNVDIQTSGTPCV